MKSDFFTLQTKDKRIEKNVLYVKLRVEKHKNIVYNNVKIAIILVKCWNIS